MPRCEAIKSVPCAVAWTPTEASRPPCTPGRTCRQKSAASWPTQASRNPRRRQPNEAAGSPSPSGRPRHGPARASPARQPPGPPQPQPPNGQMQQAAAPGAYAQPGQAADGRPEQAAEQAPLPIPGPRPPSINTQVLIPPHDQGHCPFEITCSRQMHDSHALIHMVWCLLVSAGNAGIMLLYLQQFRAVAQHASTHLCVPL